MIKEFSHHRSTDGRNKPPVVCFDRKGRVSFSVAAVQLLKLEEGTKLKFVFDPREKDMIYFYQDADGLPLKVTYTETKKKIRLNITSKGLVWNMLEFFDCKNKSMSFPVKKETVKLNTGVTAWFVRKKGK